MIEITERWGLSRLGKVSIEEQEIQVPNILFLEGENFEGYEDGEATLSHRVESTFTMPRTFFKEDGSKGSKSKFSASFGYPDEAGGGFVESKGGDEKVQILYDQDPKEEAGIYILGNAPQLLARSQKLVERVTSLREKIPFHKLIYAPAIAKPNNIALLTYLGIDLFDSTATEYFSSENIRLSDWLGFPDEGRSQDCSNNAQLMNELELVREAIDHGRLRELVESRCRSEPWMVEALREADQRYSQFSKGVPVTGDDLFATSRESLDRPDIFRFVRRMKERYKPPEREVLLFLPCSASKPYFHSPTHARIRNALQETNWPSIQDIILTSPLGAVPRELEHFYPAKQYDIPVTHRWFEKERERVLDLARSIIEKGGYSHVISHLPEDLSFVNRELEEIVDIVDTSQGRHPTDGEALSDLSDTIQDLIGSKKSSVQEFLHENMESFARFQFGRGGESLLQDAKIKGRYPEYKIMSPDGTQRGMMVSEKGLISLTLEGAKKLIDEDIYQVEIEDFQPKGSIFAVGVEDAAEEIRPGDEALVMHEGELRGVGPASMFGKEMVDAERGEAVRLRHHT